MTSAKPVYICHKNFPDGAKKNTVNYKKGDVYKGSNEELLLSKGMIADSVAVDRSSAESLEAAIEIKKQELTALMEQLKTLKAKSDLSAPEGEENQGESGEEDSDEDGAGEEELEKAHPKMPKGLTKKEQKAWHKKHG